MLLALALSAAAVAAPGHYVKGPSHQLLAPPRTLACSGNDDWDLPAARCGHDYVVGYDVKVHGHRKGQRDFPVTIEARGT